METKPQPKKFNFVGCFLIIAAGFILLAASVILRTLNPETDVGSLICYGILILVLLALAGYGGLRWYARSRAGVPQFTLSTETLRVGETFTAMFRQEVRRGITIDKILVELVFRETATYQQGTDTRTVTHNHVIESHDLPGGVFHSGQIIEQNFSFQIPLNSMHSLEVRRNKLSWLLTVKVVIPKLPDINQTHELTVLPELVR